MPRIARIVIAGLPHHVVQRGNNRQDVFFVDDDRRAYLDLLKEQCDRYGATVLGYCLMTNHVHLVVTPSAETSLAQAIGRTDFLYTQYINGLHGRCGHLWQNRFYSCALEEKRLWVAMRYVERNPVRGKLVRRAWKYPWSSAAAHVEGMDRSGVLAMEEWAERCGPKEWQEVLAEGEREEDLQELRLSTHRGRPLGADRFLAKLEGALGRRLRPLPVGRPHSASGK